MEELPISFHAICELCNVSHYILHSTVLLASDMFGMEDLKYKCMNRIPDHLTVDSVFDVLHAVAQSEGLSQLAR